MRTLLACLLLGAVAGADDDARGVAEILHGHEAALGDWAALGSLRAVSTIRSGDSVARGVVTWWDLPGRCVRDFPVPPGGYKRREFYGPDGAWIAAGVFERYRPGQRTTRAGYYLARALAEPFPLHRWMGRDGARAGLSIGSAERDDVDVLVTQPDAFGVRAAFLIDRATGLLANLRYVAEDGEALVNVTYDNWREVGGAMLPHRIDAILSVPQESEAERGFVTRSSRRVERRERYEPGADLDGIDFVPPGLGRGGGKGFATVTFPTGLDPYECAAADLDGDGRLDLAVACEGGIAVHWGDEPDRPLLVPLGGGHHRGLVIEDLDHDGAPEVVTASWVEPAGMLFTVSFPAGRGAPRTGRLYGAPHFCWTMTAADLDRDGIADLVSTGLASRDLSIKWGSGAGGFRVATSHWPLSTSAHPNRRGFGVTVADLDGDPMDDLVASDGQRLVVFQGRDNGAFLPTAAVPLPEWARPVAVAAADLDGDGRDELVCANAWPDRDLRHDLVVVRNREDALEARDLVAAGVRTEDVVALRLDGDDRPDLAVASFLSGEIVVLLNDGDGGFGPARAFVSGRGTGRLATGDWDADGRADVIATNRLDGTVTVLLNRLEGGAAPSPAPPRARTAPAAPPLEHRIEGLSSPYSFAGEFLIPGDIPDPSGLAALDGSPAATRLVMVSDKLPGFFRLTLDRGRGRLLVGPRVPLRGLEGERLDLEGIAWDRHSLNLFLACEADSSVVRASLFGNVFGREPTGVESEGNDGIEAVAVRRLPDNTPLLYVFKERRGMTARPPDVRCFALDEDPFRLIPRGEPFVLPVATPDQTGAAADGDRCFVMGRLQRRLYELPFSGDGFATDGVRYADLAELLDNRLGLYDPDRPVYGLVEGVARDPRSGDLFLLVDHNRKTVGREGRNRAAVGRLLWFRNEAAPASRPVPRRVRLGTIVVPAVGGDIDPAQAERLARECLERARAGEDWGRLTRTYRWTGADLPAELGVVHEGVRPLPGERPVGRLAPALASAAFALDVGEVTLCEYHEKDCPAGWIVVKRLE